MSATVDVARTHFSLRDFFGALRTISLQVQELEAKLQSLEEKRKVGKV